MLETIIILLVLIVLILGSIATLWYLTYRASKNLEDPEHDLDELGALTETLYKTQQDFLKKEALYEERYRTVITLIPHIFYVLDTDGNFTFCRNAEELQWSCKELQGKHFSVLFHPDCLDNISLTHLLKKLKDPDYREKLIQSGNPPGLADERRSGKRMTRREPVTLICKDWNGEPDKVVNGRITVSGLLSSAGFYDQPVRSEEKEFLGSMGIIELEK